MNAEELAEPGPVQAGCRLTPFEKQPRTGLANDIRCDGQADPHNTLDQEALVLGLPYGVAVITMRSKP